MAVLLPDRDLTVTVHEHQFTQDSMGQPVRSSTTVTRGPYAGAAKEQPDGTWRLRLDTRVWEVRPQDEITDGTLTWVVSSAQLNVVPGHSDADHVAVAAVLNPPKVP